MNNPETLNPTLRPESAHSKTIVLAGATGHLGKAIAVELLQRGATVKALVRNNSPQEQINLLREQGAIITEVDFTSAAALREACAGAWCVVSALSGLREVIVEVQTRLLQAAIAAGVKRFIPSDFCIDFTNLPQGTNRNLDLRREFAERLKEAPIAATSILNGMFTDLLTAQAPVVLFPLKRVLYWGSATQPLDFTTMADTAAYTAAAALDDSATPRFLRIAGQVATVKDLQQAASRATGDKFGLLRLGGLGVLAAMIKVTRALMPKTDEVFPPWQGMQYLHNMFTGLPKLQPLDNNRYPDITWTSVQQVLEERSAE